MNTKYLNIVVIASVGISLLSPSLALAKSKTPPILDKFPPNPLEIKQPDPLLPSAAPKESLTRQERKELEVALDDLNQQANAKFQAGDKQGAFDIWNREIRLRRYLGSIPEIQALSRVGAIAWRQNNRQQVFSVTQRLQKIQKNQEKNLELEVLQALGEAYQQVRTPKEALEVYNQVRSLVRKSQNTAQEIEVLNTIGALHLAWFDYSKAAATYEELLGLATATGERINEIRYLEELAYIYDKTQQAQQSLNVLTKLAQIYSQGNNQLKLSAVKLAIGSNYESLAKKNPDFLEKAFKNYQAAYTTAWNLQQYVRAGEALQKLITLYSSQGQIEEALQTNKILIETAKRATNLYSLMSAYDQIAKLYLQSQNYPQAMVAFQQGLQLAKQLKHQESYFSEEINKLSSKITNE